MNTGTLTPVFQTHIDENDANASGKCRHFQTPTWLRNSRLGLEALAFTTGGNSRHPNEDGILIQEAENLLLALADETSRKVGVGSGDALSIVMERIRKSRGTPATLLSTAHMALRKRLGEIGTHCRVGVSAIAVEFKPAGRFNWASVGDCSVVQWKCERWWHRQSIRRQNPLHRDMNGQLTQALGTESMPRAEAGNGTLHRGDMLLIGSDGVFHEKFDLLSAMTWIEANKSRPDATMEELAYKLHSEARLTQPVPDDSSLILIRKI